MASDSITHLKLFVDQGERQVALFSGDDQQQDWLRNEAAETVLTNGWELLPQETLMSLAEVSAKGLLQRAFLASDALSQAGVIEAWTMRKARMASRLADAATTTGDRATEAQHSQRVVDCLEEMLASCTDDQRQQEISQQRSAYLLRAVDCRLALWNNMKDPAQAEALALLFAALADRRWPNASIDVATADSNKVFWRNQALRAWGDASKTAEEQGAIDQAERCCSKVLQLLQDQALNA